MGRTIAGVMKWGQWGARLDKISMSRLITDCLECGITTFDHANIYGGYTTETEWGHAWNEVSLERDTIEIISKCGICYPCESRPHYKIKFYDHSFDHIVASALQSVKNLQCEYLDLLLIHRPGPLMNPQEMARAFDWLQARGVVRKFGVSNFNAHQMELLINVYPLAANQIEFSMLHMDAMYDGTLDYCMNHKIEVQAWSPLGGGKLFSDSAEYDFVLMRERLREVGEHYQLTLEEMAYLFILKHPAMIRPVTGSSQSKRIQTATLCESKSIEPELWYSIWTSVQGQKVP